MNSAAGPKHVGIIMDGNGRWARSKNLLRIYGHRQGARVVSKIVQACSDRGIRILTLYAFSTENWARPSAEVSLLMKLLKIYVTRERARLCRDNVRLSVIGDISKIAEPVRKELLSTMEATQNCSGLVLQLALNYGGREEILRAVEKYTQARLKGEEKGPVDESRFADFLDTQEQPDPDLIIRTSGEQRLSNFLIWQSAYSEFYFTDCLWPDFNEEELDRALEAYHQRSRRFGRVDESLAMRKAGR